MGRSRNQEKAIHANLKGFNLKTRKMETIQNPTERRTSNGRLQIVGTGSDGTKIFRFVKG